MKRSLRSNRGAADATLLWLLLAVGALLVLGLVAFYALRAKGSRSDNQQEFSLSWRLSPSWGKASPATQPKTRTEPRDLAVHIDLSRPVGGFLPLTSGGEPSDFEFLVYQMGDRLVAASGGTRSRLQWWGVSEGVVPIERPEPLVRALFAGNNSRLDLSIDSLLRGLGKGKLRAAVLITDLVATEELTGAMGVAKALSDWMSSAQVQGGSFHAGLLGVRVPYWGVQTKHCSGTSLAGCWFSEHAQVWRPLPTVTKVPFYVLVLGIDEAEVRQIGESLLASATGRKVEAHWELFSDSAQTKVLEGSCRISRPGQPGRQFVLIRQEDATYRCQTGAGVAIECTLPELDALAEPKFESSWPSAQPVLEGGKVTITLDCDELRGHPPTTDLLIRASGPPRLAANPIWEGWSADTDATEASLSRTLQLASFLAKVQPRPEEFEMISGTLLRGVKRGNS